MKFCLPIPPSTNTLFRNVRGRGRVKTRQYKAWLKNADAYYYMQDLGRRPKINGPYTVAIRAPKSRKDLPNLEKALGDFLVSRGLTWDDKYLRKLTMEIDPTLTDCEVTVEEFYDAHDDVEKSFDAAYEVVRERVKAGGQPWKPKP